MARPAPMIDERSAADITRQLRELLPQYLGEGVLEDNGGKYDAFTESLIAIFSRYCEIIIERLNRAPGKNFLAFLDLLGVAPLPSQPARAPLTFNLTPGAPANARISVPAGTQVAALPGEGEEQPVVFETEREMMATVAHLTALMLRDIEQDAHADHAALLDAEAPDKCYLLQADRRTEHLLYIGHDVLLGMPYTQSIDLVLTLVRPMMDPGKLVWEVWDGANWKEKTPEVTPAEHSSDLTQLPETGNQTTLRFTDIGPVPTHSLQVDQNAEASRWLRCRLLTPITPGTEPRVDMVRGEWLPAIGQLRVRTELARAADAQLGLMAELAFANAVPLDVSREFPPFGDQPKRYDAFYVASAEAFSKAGGMITLDLAVSNPHYEADAVSVYPSADLRLAWECWDGTAWQTIGTSQPPDWLSPVDIETLKGPIVTQLEGGGTLTTAVLEGRLQEGIDVQITGRAAQRSLSIEGGRFAAEFLVDPGYNVFEVKTGVGTQDEQSLYAVVVYHVETLELTLPTVFLELQDVKVVEDQQQAEVTVKITGADADDVDSIAIRNGRTGSEVVYEEPIVDREVTLMVPLVYGRNPLLIQALITAQDGTTELVAAQTRVLGLHDAKPRAFESGLGVDGTHGLCQSGQITLMLPPTLGKTVINGQPAYWLRARIQGGDYGKAASYRLKNPLDPGEGYALLLETFRPPVVSSLIIGYQQTLEAAPQKCYTCNNGRCAAVPFADLPLDPPLVPFTPEADDRKTVYLGFALPGQLRTFPNTTVSLFARVADFNYAEQSVPYWPFSSERSGNLASTVSHPFTVTNPSPLAGVFKFELHGMSIRDEFGTSWHTSVSMYSETSQDFVPVPAEGFTLEGGASQKVRVDVDIPSSAQLGETDWGFMRLINEGVPDEYFSAVFVTRVEPVLTAPGPAKLAWQYWNGERWQDLVVRDDTDHLRRTGAVTFLAPADFAVGEQFGRNAYWLRAVWESGRYALEPRLEWLRLNTTMAAQTMTLRDEVLGSSNGTADQTFQLSRAPVLSGLQLTVRERERPSATEREKLESEEGMDAIETPEGDANGTQTVWVRWHQVTDFYGSAPRDRHCVLDHESGELRFGDGINGMIPPIGKGNVRAARYQTGGGKIGNQPAGTIVQLKTTLPYVESVTNPDAAAGGANMEEQTSFMARAPRTIRHRGRAVTAQDYEDLAMLASPRVARSKSVSLFDLVKDPDGTIEQPGIVSIIIVPRSEQVRPIPTQELTQRVHDYVSAHSIPTAVLMVVGPEYIRVNVSAEIVVTSLDVAGEVIPAVDSALKHFLHPLTGGADKEGWDFGRTPQRSDFFALLEGVAGVKYVRTLDWVLLPEREGLEATGRFLIYSGTHVIRLAFEDT